MSQRKRRTFSREFKADAVRLVTAGGKNIAEVTKQFGICERSLRNWVREAESLGPPAPVMVLAEAERTELTELRKRVKRLEMEREILKKAAAFFARESA